VITEADLAAYQASQLCDREQIHGYLAIETARMMKIFEDENENWETVNSPISIASGGDHVNAMARCNGTQHCTIEWNQ
jgi:hypothetical protein